MPGWREFKTKAPEIAQAGVRLLAANEVAFLATVSKAGRPRIHPFVPKIVDDRLVAFIGDRSPKYFDLIERRWYAVHALPGAEDEEFYIAGEAIGCNDEAAFRERAGEAMGFVTALRDDEQLFEFRIDSALWTRWLDFGTPNHRPEYVRWRADS